MAASFQTREGQDIKDGAKVRLILMYGPAEVEADGTIRFFEQKERVYDEEGIAVSTTSEGHWELVTDDPHHPAIGFLPQNVKTRL